jgi:demethylmenaquinone methyltransferase/2-methoxy-6-polyprenyl-1,4-benzoquinol methylase
VQALALPGARAACEPSGVAPNPVTAQPGRARDQPLRGEPVARTVFTGLPGRYDRLAYLLSFGQDRRWRRAVVARTAAGAPRRVLDVATGPAGVALAVAARTGADVVGVDLNEPMLRAGLPRIRRAGGRGRVRVAAARADQLPFADATFDAVTFSYLLRYVDNPGATIAEMARCLRPGGTLACLEFGVPPRPAWRAAWWCYTRLALPVLGGLTGGAAWYRVGRFLGPSISAHYRRYPVPAHVAAWRAAGLTEIGTEEMSLGGGLIMWGRKDTPGPGS